MAVKLSRKGIVLLTLLILLIVGGATGYIIWRTYQNDRLDPVDSDASGGGLGGGDCCISDCSPGYDCEGIVSANQLCELAFGKGYKCNENGDKCIKEDFPDKAFACNGGGDNNCSSILSGTGNKFCVSNGGNSNGCYMGVDFGIDVTVCGGGDLDNETCYCSTGANGNPPYCWDAQDNTSMCGGGGGGNEWSICNDLVSCEFPKAAYWTGEGSPDENTCICKNWYDQTGGEDWECKGEPPNCNPGECPAGMIDCGDSKEHENDPLCQKQGNKSCSTDCPGCNNESIIYRYCKPAAANNPPACTGLIMKKNGTTVNDATVQASDALSFTLSGTDPDGAPGNMMICFALDNQSDSFYTQANGANWYCYAKGAAGNSYTVNTTFETVKNAYLAKVTSVTEQQIIDNGFTVATNIFDNSTTATNFCTSNPAYVSAEQAVLWPAVSTDPSKTCSALGTGCDNSLKLAAPPAQCGDGVINPELGEQCDPPGEPSSACTYGDCSLDCKCPSVDAGFEVQKTGAGICVEGSTTYSDVTYTITVQNNGSTIGHVSQIVDTLDPDIDESWILDSTIDPSTNVTVAAGTITWELVGNDQIFDPGEDMTFKYTVRIPEAAFGTYENSVEVVVTDEGADNVTDTYTIDVNCDETPDTGIFDSVAGRVTVAILLIIASAVYLYSDGADRFMIRFATSSGRLNDARAKFEKKASNKKS
ncbi:MAG: hypothetical protein Fur003_4700 [Candidatus Dojkabacteria bacterium]